MNANVGAMAKNMWILIQRFMGDTPDIGALLSHLLVTPCPL